MIKTLLTLFTPAPDRASLPRLPDLLTIFGNFQANRNDVKSASRRTLSRLAVTLAVGMLCAGSTMAQPTTPVAVLRTGEGMPVNSAVQALDASGGATSLQFAFGFSTDEEIAPGLILDSFTLSLAEAEGPLSVIFNTTDRTGSVWAPPTPGTILVSPDSILRQPITFPDLSPNHLHQFAYLVSAPIPGELQGKALNFYADLFDNADSTHSLGWVSTVTLVPEPPSWLLSLVGIACVFGIRWRASK